MTKSFKAIFMLLILLESSKCLGQDKLNPDYFIKLQKRTDAKIDSLKLDPLLTYIKPGTNIKIKFLENKMREAIGWDSSENLLRQLGSLNALKESLQEERDKKIEEAIASDTSVKNGIWRKFEQKIDDQVTKPQIKLVESRAIKLTVKATITLKNGKTYDVTVPNYCNVIPTGDTMIVSSITQRVFGFSSEEGFKDRIVNTEIDLVQEHLSENDMVKLELETDDGGMKRTYIKRFLISEYGWKLEFPPSVLFIKRIHEPKDSTGKEINPSDFKPAPGGSMLFTYKPKGGLGNQLLGLSFGLNVSLLDFEVDKNLELGVGFVIYWPNRLVGAGYGWNLHASEKKSYWFISLDFLRTFETFKAIF
jgi:hypothetical protein